MGFRHSWCCLGLIGTLVGAACGDDGGDQDPNANADVVFWAPKHIGMRVLWDIDLDDRLAAESIVGALVEEDLAFQDIEARVRAVIDSGMPRADVVMVPWGIGQRLLADGVIVEPYRELFSATDEDAAKLWGVVVAQPASTSARVVGRAESSPLVFQSDGCLTPESHARIATTVSESADVVASGLVHTPLLDNWQLVDGSAEASGNAVGKIVTDKLKEMGAQRAVTTGANAIAGAYSTQVGEMVAERAATQAVAIKVVGVFFKGVSFIMDYKAFLESIYRSVELNDATADAYESALQTWSDGTKNINDLTTEMLELRLGIINCSVSGKDALERLDELTNLVRTYENAARTGITQATTIEGEISPHWEEATDNAKQKFTQTWVSVRADAQKKADAVNASNSTLQSLTFDDPATPDAEWEVFAELLTGLELGNGFVHSNGTLMTMSAGNTDIIRAGGAVIDVSGDAADYLFGTNGRYPCGTGMLGHTLCGGMPFPAGPARVFVVDYDALLPPPSDGYHYQYGFVFDGDGDASNNYMAPSLYPMDLFDNTDIWYEAKLDATSMLWSFTSTLARNGTLASRQTAARTIINGNSMILLVPGTEFEVAAPGYRVTAFRHRGDFGINAPHDFNGDVYPAVGLALAMPSTTSVPGRYDSRTEKIEYTAEVTVLGTSRISELAVPATANHDLATTAGAYGYRIKVPAGGVIRACVSSTMSASLNYYPQFSPGYTFVDGAPGCTDVTNIDATAQNWVLLKVAGAGSPNNVTVTTSVP